MEGLRTIPYIVMILAISGIIGGVSVVVLDSFGSSSSITQCTTATDTWVLADDGCTNGSDYTSNATTEYRAILDATTSVGSLQNQLPTVAVIAVMVIIISMIAGVFVYLKYFN